MCSKSESDNVTESCRHYITRDNLFFKKVPRGAPFHDEEDYCELDENAQKTDFELNIENELASDKRPTNRYGHSIYV